jgi:hypothetical protein
MAARTAPLVEAEIVHDDDVVRSQRRDQELLYSSGVGRLYAEDLTVKIEGAAGTMIVSV